MPVRAGTDIDAVGLGENRIARGDVERPNAGVAADNKKPSLSIRFQAPSGVWR